MDEVGGYIDAELNERLLGILSTKENVNLETLGFGDESKSTSIIITPIDVPGSGWEPYLNTGAKRNMTLMTLF